MTRASRIDVLTIGAHRGASTILDGLTDWVRMTSAWTFVDPKPGRAEDAAEHAPTVPSRPQRRNR